MRRVLLTINKASQLLLLCTFAGRTVKMLALLLIASVISLVSSMTETSAPLQMSFSSEKNDQRFNLASPTSDMILDIHIGIDLKTAGPASINSKGRKVDVDHSRITPAPHSWTRYDSSLLGQLETLQSENLSNITAGLLSGSSHPSYRGLMPYMTNGTSSSGSPFLPTTTPGSAASVMAFTGAALPRLGSLGAVSVALILMIMRNLG